MSKKLTFLISIIGLAILSLSILYIGSKGVISNFLIDKEIDKCSSSNDQKCFSDLVLDVFESKGLDEALNLVGSIYERNSNFASSCHDIGHLLGKETYKVFSSGKEFKITSKAAFCSYGFYHGFMENLASSESDVKKAREFCEYVDSQISKETPDATLQCFHGIGHGWVNVHDNKGLWGNEGAIAQKGLNLCEEVSETESELNRCATGVFNGIAVFYTTGEYEIKVNKNDPLWLCNKQETKYQDPCFISMNIFLMSLSDGDVKKASEYLKTIKDDSVATHAMLNLALPFGISNLNTDNHSNSVVICRSLEKRLIESCIQGYAFAFLEHGEPSKEYIKPIKFCKETYLTDSESEACLSYIYSYLPQWYSKEKVSSICDDESEHKDFCYEKVISNFENL